MNYKTGTKTKKNTTEVLSKFIWNLRPSYQPETECLLFGIHYQRKFKTIWIQLAPNKPSKAMFGKIQQS